MLEMLEGLTAREAPKDIFISFKSPQKAEGKDAVIDQASGDTAQRLESELREQFGLECFYYIHDVSPGTNFMPAILQAVENSRAVICLVSDAFFTSAYCRMELNEAKRQGKLFAFSTQPGFEPTRHQELQGVNTAALADWGGSFTHPQLSTCVLQIAKNVGRPALQNLIRLHRDSSGLPPAQFDDALLRWCGESPTDPVAPKILQKIFRARFEHRHRANDQNQRQLGLVVQQITQDVRDALMRESTLLTALLGKYHNSPNAGPVLVQDCLDLQSKEIFDPDRVDRGGSHHSTLMRETQEQRDDALRRVVEQEAEIVRLGAQVNTQALTNESLRKLLGEREASLAGAAKRITALQEEIRRRSDPTNDIIADIMAFFRDQMSAACEANVRQAWNYCLEAESLRQEAERIRVRIETQITARKTKLHRNGEYQISFATSDHDNAPAKYFGRLDVVRPGGDHIYPARYWGYFDSAPEFIGPGVMEVHHNGRPLMTFMGELEGQFPAEGRYGVVEFQPDVGSNVRSWAGSWSQSLCYGRLSRADGTMHYGKVRKRGFSVFLEDDHGVSVLANPGSGASPYELSVWREGQKLY